MHATLHVWQMGRRPRGNKPNNVANTDNLHSIIPPMDQILTHIDGASLLKAMLSLDCLLFVIVIFWRKNRTICPCPFWWTPGADPGGAEDRRYRLILSGILFTAVALRMPALNSDLWLDEILTLVHYVRLDLGAILSDFSDDNQHVLYSVLANFSVRLFGESPAALRLPALLFGVAGIWASAHLVRYVFGKREALFTAALLTLSYHHVWFSQNARGYTILLFGTMVSTELLLRGLATGRWRFWLAYAGVVALTAWAHLGAIFVALAHGLVLVSLGFYRLRGRQLAKWRWQPFIALVLAGWLTIQEYVVVLPQMYAYFNRPGAGSTTGPVAWSHPLWLAGEVLRSFGAGSVWGWLGLAGLGALGFYGLLLTFRRDALFLLLALAPAALEGITFLILGRSLWPRMFFHELGFLVAIAAVGALAIGQRLCEMFPLPGIPARYGPVVVLSALFAFSLPAVYRYPKQDYSGARDFVKMHMEKEDRVIGLHMAGRAYRLYYETDWPEVDDVDGLTRNEARRGHTWLLYTLPSYIRSRRPDLQRALAAGYDVIRVFPGTLGDGEIVVMRSKRRGSPERE